MRHIHLAEAGLLLQAEFEIEDGTCVFSSVHVLDNEYRATGPNLREFLESLFYYRGANPDGVPTGEKILSMIAGEIS